MTMFLEINFELLFGKLGTNRMTLPVELICDIIIVEAQCHR